MEIKLDSLKNGNRPNRLRASAGLAIGIGVFSLLGCTDKGNSTPTTSAVKDRIDQNVVADNNCTVEGSISISSNAEKPVSEFVDNYLTLLEQETGQVLSDCADEVYSSLRSYRSNLASGAISPEAVTDRIVLPSSVQRG